RQQNAMLLAAGFAPAWGGAGLPPPAGPQGEPPLLVMVPQHEAYPPPVVDPPVKLLRAHPRPARLLRFPARPPPPPAPRSPPPPSLAGALLAPEAWRPFILSWEEPARFFLRGVQGDAAAEGTAETAELLARLLKFPGLPALYEALPAHEAKAPVLVIDFRKDA